MLLRVGTRGSKLSLVQTDLVTERLRQTHRGLEIEKVIIRTAGDKDRETPIFFLDQKGVFEKEIDQAVQERRVDFAVHSLKDLPIFQHRSRLVIAGLPERGSPADVLVSHGDKTLQELRRGSTVGTSSLLRIAQLKRTRPDLEAKPIRGNVETRIQKVDKGEYDAVILAEAGLARLGIANRISERLSLEDFLPAPGQGIIATVAMQDSEKVLDMLRRIEHSPTRWEAEAERELVSMLEGGCKVPIGALASCSGDTIELTACILSVDGRQRLETKMIGRAREALDVARKAGNDLLSQGAKRLEEGWRKLYA